MATNLEFIKSASATSTTSISVTDCFTSNYDVYAITLNGFTNSSGNPSQLSLRFLDNTDSPITTANYDTAVLNGRSDSSFVEYRNTNQTDSEFFGQVDYPPESTSAYLNIYNPTDTSSYTFFNVQTSSAVSAVLYGFKGIGVLTETTEVTGIQFLGHTTHTFDEGTVSVYGVK
mgnify:CR=1 FL=1